MTPGPWKWFNYPDGRKLLAGQERAVIHCPDASMACDEEDQRLIVAAPDLLAAARLAVGFIETLRDELGLPVEAEKVSLALRAALAKVDGGVQ